MQSEMRTCLFLLGWGTGHFNPLLVSETLQPSFSSRHSPHLPLGSGGVKGQAIVLDPQERRTVANCGIGCSPHDKGK